MPSISCPKSLSLDSCNFLGRKGKVRDAPNTGVKQCISCGVVTHTNDLSTLVNYEHSSMWDWLSNSLDDLPPPQNDVERRVKALNIQTKDDKGSSLLDVGCGGGEMLMALSDDFEVFGIEPEKSMREKIISNGFKCWESNVEPINLKLKFNVITLFHVIEHIYNPFEILKSCFDLLEQGGRIYIETPNADDALLTTYKCEAFENFTYWSHHPMLHTNESLSACLEKVGFKVEYTRGVQRYSLSNHIFWLTSGKPGGHEVLKELFSKETLEKYDSDLISQGKNDTIWIVAKKC